MLVCPEKFCPKCRKKFGAKVEKIRTGILICESVVKIWNASDDGRNGIDPVFASLDDSGLPAVRWLDW